MSVGNCTVSDSSWTTSQGQDLVKRETVARAPAVPVMMYHHISPVVGTATTTPKNFESHLAWLRRRGYRALSADAFAAHLKGAHTPRKSVLITFDDGYLDNWVYAYPLLKKYGFTASMFLITGWMGEGAVRGRVGAGSIPATPSHFECNERIAAGQHDDVMLRWSEIQAMRSEGVIEFHSHTHTHTRWDYVKPDRRVQKMKEDLQLSRATLKDALGSVSDHLCWPQGYFESDYVSLAQEQGFNYLYTTRAYGQNRPGSDPTSIYRIAARDRHGSLICHRLWVANHPFWGNIYNKRKIRKTQEKAS